MKREALFATIVSLLILFITATTNADFYVIPVPQGVGARITNLPHTITSSGYYYLGDNLTSTGNGITVEADNVTTDLCGFSLIGPGSSSGGNYGIYLSARSNIEIRNGTVREFGSHGIYGSGAACRNNRVLGVTIRDSGGTGMYLDGRGHQVTSCNAYQNGGTGIHTSYYSRIHGCSAIQNGNYGISSLKGCTVSGNTAAFNATNGIGASDGNEISGNTANNNSQNGISAVGRGNTISNNAAQDNEDLGLYAAIGNTVIGNAAYSNGSSGILVGAGCTVKNNTSSFNQGDGIDLAGNCLVDGNTAYHNNESSGSYVDIRYADCTGCQYGVNNPPAP